MIRFDLKRTRALLAGATVLGIGAAGTLAVWSDAEFASGFFSFTPRLVAEGSSSQAGPFASHESAGDAAELSFDFPADGLQLGEAVEAEYWLRMVTDAPASATITAPDVENERLSSNIDVTVTDGACGQSGTALQSGRLGELQEATAFTLPAGTPDGPGAAQPVCITAELVDTDGLEHGEPYSTGSVNWNFVLTEVEV